MNNLLACATEAAIPLIQGIEKLIELSDYAVEGRYSIISDDLNDSEIFTGLIQKLIASIES
ncbi:MAG: hypothetical protein J0647_07360 [Campylobacteraceae bacterium]|nr:hypothetical protein [Campylobacteraceae bacterium]